MGILNTFKKVYAVTGFFALLAVFSLSQVGSSAFAACAIAWLSITLISPSTCT